MKLKVTTFLEANNIEPGGLVSVLQGVIEAGQISERYIYKIASGQGEPKHETLGIILQGLERLLGRTVALDELFNRGEAQPHITIAEPKVPTLLTPQGIIPTLTPTLTVSAPDARCVEFTMKNLLSNFSVAQIGEGQHFSILETFLCKGVDYSWTARVFNGERWSDPAPSFTFQIAGAKDKKQAMLSVTPATPLPLEPVGIINTLRPELVVSDVNAPYYGFYIRDLESLTLVYTNEFGSEPCQVVPEGVLTWGKIISGIQRQGIVQGIHSLARR